MKLIDEKGRLFSLINLIDFFVLLFLLAMIPAFIFGTKIIFRQPLAPESFGEDVKEIKLNCEFIRLKTNVAEMISAGDETMDDKGRVIGEIIELGSIEPYKEDPLLKQRLATLKLKAQLKGTDVYYKGTIIDTGSEFMFVTDKYSAIAKIKESISKIFRMRVTLKNLDENMVNLIAVGDKEVDVTSRIAAEILKIGRPEQNIQEVNLTGGNIAIASDINKKQIPTELLLKCQVINEDGQQQVYFKGKRITNITPIEIVTNKYRAEGLVSKSYETTSERNFRWVSLTVKFSGVTMQIRDVLKEGDIEVDFYGVPMARIVKVINDEPAKIIATRENKVEEFMLPYQRDMLVAMDVFCEEREGTFYFKNYSVKMGNSIIFSTSLYSISGSVVGIEIR